MRTIKLKIINIRKRGEIFVGDFYTLKDVEPFVFAPSIWDSLYPVLSKKTTIELIINVNK